MWATIYEIYGDSDLRSVKSNYSRLLGLPHQWALWRRIKYQPLSIGVTIDQWVNSMTDWLPITAQYFDRHIPGSRFVSPLWISFVYLKGAGRKGSTLIEDKRGFTFSHHVTNKIGQEKWVCSRKKTLCCRAGVKILDGFILEQNVHNHPPYE